MPEPEIAMNDLGRLFWWNVTTLLLTILHHAYGASIYQDAFRLHVVFLAIPFLLILVVAKRGMMANQNNMNNSISKWVFILLSAVVILAIGVYEGGYNHLVKNVLYFAGVSRENLDDLYPVNYELPNDFIFELTGILQFISGAVGVYYGYSAFRNSSGNAFNTLH